MYEFVILFCECAPELTSTAMSRAKYRSRKPVDDVDDYEDEADAQITLIGRPLPGESSGSHGGSTMIRPPKQDKFAELRAGVVTDSRGNQRFHGAFTGGFSAGYFNSVNNQFSSFSEVAVCVFNFCLFVIQVGTIAGFKPTAFVSSRARRADSSALRAEDYMDEEDRAESAEAGKTLVAKSEFDTFGATENELTRKRSAAVGKALASLIVPASDSVGVKLLKKMGWREGEPIAAKADPAAPQRKIATVSMPPHMV
jgi:G patch domain-containing protein 1